VRANIERLVGGAGEETIVARVGEGIVTTVGSAETHKAVLENPDLISRTVLSKGLDAGDDGLLAGAADQLLDVGAHRDAGLCDQLDAVLGHGGHGRRVDHLGVDRHLHGLEHVAARQVDGRRHLEIQHDVGLLGRNQRVHHVRDVAAREVVGLQLVGIEAQSGFRALDHRRNDGRGRDLAPTHQHQLQQADTHARHQGREPQSHRNKIEEEPDRKKAHEDDQHDHSTLKIHNLAYLIVFTITLKFSNPTTSTSRCWST